MTDNEKILAILKSEYPDARPALNFKNAYELLVAVILSAQCTDVRVNKVTEVLFEKYPDPASLAACDISELEDVIHSCGCYKVKAKNLKSMANDLIEKFGGQVPRTMEELTSLAGCGRKTANVIMSNAFGIPAIAVDTHVFRVSNRLGLAQAKDVLKTEQQLRDNIPEQDWSDAHHWLIFHGRRVCTARAPRCAECALKELCRYNRERTTTNDSR